MLTIVKVGDVSRDLRYTFPEFLFASKKFYIHLNQKRTRKAESEPIIAAKLDYFI